MNAEKKIVSTDVCDPDNPKGILIDFNKTYLTTFYYRTMPYPYADNDIIGPRYNYSPYDLWCLKTNISPLFSSINLTYIIKGVQKENKMVLAIFPKKDGKAIEMSTTTISTLQNEINYICENLYKKCLLYDPMIKSDFGAEWTMNIFPYLSIDTKYNPRFINGKLYIELNENSDYDVQFAKCSSDLIEQIADLYLQGAINCDSDFAKNWDMIEYRKDIYIPNWSDNRITNDRANFLITLLHGKNILLKTIPDMLLKHQLSLEYKEDILFEINTGNILIKPTQIKQIYDILNVIENYKFNYGKEYTIFTLPINDIKLVEKYCTLVKQQYPNAHCTYYKITGNPRNKYMFSAVANIKEPETENTLTKLLK
jgi:hypothetical protein